jgi:hypothetical protein
MARLVWLVWLVWLFWLVWLVWLFEVVDDLVQRLGYALPPLCGILFCGSVGTEDHVDAGKLRGQNGSVEGDCGNFRASGAKIDGQIPAAHGIFNELLIRCSCTLHADR